jgi:transposase
VFIDEAGFYLLPALARSYAPVGCTPLLRVPLTRDHLSVVSAITPDGRLFTLTQEHAFKGPDFGRFLKHLLRHRPGKLLVIWDGLPAHRSSHIRDFLAQGGAERIHLERLPGYAPDLNPDEGVWRYLKHVELRNCCCRDLAHLRLELRKAIARFRHKSHLILACFRHSLGDNFTLSCSGQ